MDTVLNKIKREIIKLLAIAKVKADIDDIVTPPDKKMGDFSFACFGPAKKQKKDPAKLGQEIVAKLKGENKFFEKIEAAGPYINFFINPNAVAKITLENISKQKNKFGQSRQDKKNKILLEFSQPNTHKEFHIGHARNALLGQSLVNILHASGYKVIPANYIGDTGAHVSKWIWAYQKFHRGEEPREDRAKFLSQVYQEAVEKISADEGLKKEVSQIHQKLEQGDKELIGIWKKSRGWSMEEFKKIYKILNIDFDVYFYESEEEGPGKKMVAELIEQGVAKESQGAVIIDLEKYNLGVLLLLRSDGTMLYATKDIPLAFKKFEKFKIDESWYLVDSRQSFYFQQLFKALEIIGLKKPLKHLIYEFVATPEGVISSRAGQVPSFIDTFEFVTGLAEQSTKQRHPEWPEKKINQTAKIIALAAIKFEMLKSSREREIVFDPKKALSFEGFTGPYLLYTSARINSILKKQRPGRVRDWKNITIAPLEKQLVIKMLSFPEIVAEAAESAQPSIISQYLFDLAQKFAEFYHEINVLKAEEPERTWRLGLIRDIKQVLENGLGLLGIESLEEM